MKSNFFLERQRSLTGPTTVFGVPGDVGVAYIPPLAAKGIRLGPVSFIVIA